MVWSVCGSTCDGYADANAAKLARGSESKAVDRLLAKARRIVREVRVSEERGEERHEQNAGRCRQVGAPQRLCGGYGRVLYEFVEVAQAQLDELCGSERVRYVEDVEAELV